MEKFKLKKDQVLLSSLQEIEETVHSKTKLQIQLDAKSFLGGNSSISKDLYKIRYAYNK